jgi:hypothetical protein
LRLHPLARLYRRALGLLGEAEAKLAEVGAELGRVEAELEELKAELAGRYGPGYLTVKSVRNRQGKRYRYPVWRTHEGKDVYLRGEEGRRYLELREKLRSLRREYSRYRKMLLTAKTYVRAAREYADVCIDMDSGMYVENCTAVAARMRQTIDGGG